MAQNQEDTQAKTQTEPATSTHSESGNEFSQSARENSRPGGQKQTHEDRENPDRDHVPGHKGYTRQNLRDVVTPEDDDQT